MVEVRCEADRVIFEVLGFHKVWALRSRLVIPAAHILGARRAGDAVRGWKGWRLPGTWIPGIITAGTFYRHGRSTFWDVSRGENAVVVDLENEKYHRLVIEVEDPDAVVSRLAGVGRSRGAAAV